MRISDDFSGHISLDEARRRSVGAQSPHVAAPYTRALIGDATQRRSIWGPYPRLERLMRLAVAISLVAFCWVIAVLLVAVLVGLVIGVFS